MRAERDHNNDQLTYGSVYMENAYMVSAGMDHTLILLRVEGGEVARTEVYRMAKEL